MTTVKCNLKFCTNNIDETCQLRHIDLTLGWGIYDYDNCGCSCFDDITEHEDYKEYSAQIRKSLDEHLELE